MGAFAAKVRISADKISAGAAAVDTSKTAYATATAVSVIATAVIAVGSKKTRGSVGVGTKDIW